MAFSYERGIPVKERSRLIQLVAAWVARRYDCVGWRFGRHKDTSLIKKTYATKQSPEETWPNYTARHGGGEICQANGSNATPLRRGGGGGESESRYWVTKNRGAEVLLERDLESGRAHSTHLCTGVPRSKENAPPPRTTNGPWAWS